MEPTPLKNPRLVCFSPEVLTWLEIDQNEVKRPDFAEFFCGNKLLPGARPAAHWFVAVAEAYSNSCLP